MAGTIYELDVLRTFSTGIALGSFAKAADRLGRSTSAVSAQLKKLEEQAGTALLRKAGRGLELTAAGETLLAYAHRLLDLNDEAVAAVRGADLEGLVRLGLQEDLGEAILPAVLGRFARAHPKVRIEAIVARSVELREKVQLGKLDVAIVWDPGLEMAQPNSRCIARLPLQWIGPHDIERSDLAHWVRRRSPATVKEPEPLPLVLLEMPCPIRTLVTSTLEHAGIPWRHAFSSASLGALWAAASAGLGLTVRTSLGLPANVRIVERSGTRLPALPQMSLVLFQARAELEPPLTELSRLLVEAIQAHCGLVRV